MTDKMKEDISALIDAQLSEHEHARVLKALAQDQELRKIWERYHIIRSALRKDLGPVVSSRLSDQIGEHIGELPAHSYSAIARPRNWKPVGRWVASLALAASVAAIAVLGTQWFVPAKRSDVPQRLTTVPSQGGHTQAGIRWDTGEPEVAKLLNLYLVEHNEFTPTAGMNGAMSYGRFVSYDDSR
ncbi:MAG: sigma-E factor negative regulatory protein [Acidiferrobacterales bacterium]